MNPLHSGERPTAGTIALSVSPPAVPGAAMAHATPSSRGRDIREDARELVSIWEIKRDPQVQAHCVPQLAPNDTDIGALHTDSNIRSELVYSQPGHLSGATNTNTDPSNTEIMPDGPSTALGPPLEPQGVKYQQASTSGLADAVSPVLYGSTTSQPTPTHGSSSISTGANAVQFAVAPNTAVFAHYPAGHLAGKLYRYLSYNQNSFPFTL
ncbi:hypothetical protein SARC_00191 [Sphaeroforma arctica JP610]|uniref:Uncharacterized protein n=1 Tax=Sphaeroforma arctica JP610 TaxID=667725 RepID=A0A0L0GH78_9EUKA|nr:hypothetical protein SARC_00191 [Sphaeroforma arctica JP610]KNC87683.1 hypothetical protein SARC_00191 [Sphaeroforma arctica JP610]|eukprot:XP_014161585.1 hypothetical protein SARC_00191 [Sphaeroforma arctica JP610]